MTKISITSSVKMVITGMAIAHFYLAYQIYRNPKPPTPLDMILVGVGYMVVLVIITMIEGGER